MFKKAITLVRQDVFLKNNVIFFVGSIFIAFLNYLYHPLMSRLMSVEQFGEVQTIFSFVFFLSIILTIFRMIVLNITTNDEGRLHEDGSVQRTTISSLYTAALIIHAPMIFLLVVASPAISRFFAFETSWTFAIFALCLLISIPSTFYGAYLHGKNEFTILSLSQVIVAGGKLVLAAGLVLLGGGVFGAIGAMGVASLIALGYLISKSSGFRLSLVSPRSLFPVLKKEFPYSMLVFVSLGLVTVLFSADILVVKRLFSPEVAGMYSGVATIARIIFFTTASIATVLISSVKISNTARANHAILKKALFFVCLIGGGVLVVFALFPERIIGIMVGHKYLPLAHLLPILSLSLFLVSILNLLVSYFLALRNMVLLRMSLLGFAVTIALVLVNHATPEAVVADFVVGTGFVLVLLTYFIFFPKKIAQP